jgi:uncharacterized membrane protein
MSGEQYNIDLANRQIEINTWSYNNKMDTLFVFQILFMSILFIAILMGLKSTGLIGAVFVWYSFIILCILVSIIVINRTMYTNYRRDQRHWNKMHFNDDNTKPSPLGRGDASYQEYLDSVRTKYGGSKTSCDCST